MNLFAALGLILVFSSVGFATAPRDIQVEIDTQAVMLAQEDTVNARIESAAGQLGTAQRSARYAHGLLWSSYWYRSDVSAAFSRCGKLSFGASMRLHKANFDIRERLAQLGEGVKRVDALAQYATALQRAHFARGSEALDKAMATWSAVSAPLQGFSQDAESVSRSCEGLAEDVSALEEADDATKASLRGDALALAKTSGKLAAESAALARQWRAGRDALKELLDALEAARDSH